MTINRVYGHTIKNELVQVKGTNLVQQIEDHVPRSFTRIIRRVRCHWHYVLPAQGLYYGPPPSPH